jgi:hypothetical protein
MKLRQPVGHTLTRCLTFCLRPFPFALISVRGTFAFGMS